MKNILLLMVLLATGCTKYQTQFDGPYDDDANGPVHRPKVYEIVYVQDDRLFMATADLRYNKQLPVPGAVRRASINYSHDRIAYKTASGGITVVDTAGTVLEALPNTSTVRWFDWHANDRTLYLLQDNKLKLYGPAVPLAVTNLEAQTPVGDNLDITTVAVAPDGTVYFGYSVDGGWENYRRIKVVHPAGSGQPDYEINTQWYDPQRLRLDRTGNSGVYSGKNTSTDWQTADFLAGSSTLFEFGSSNIRMAAVSPETLQRVFWTSADPSLWIYNSDQTLGILNMPLDDLDW